MQEQQNRFLFLYRRFIQDQATSAEVREFWELADGLQDDETVKDAMYQLFEEPVPEQVEQKDWTKASRRILGSAKRSLITRSVYWAAAASVICVLLAGTYVFMGDRKEAAPPVVAKIAIAKQQDILPPAVSYATITLANGQRMAIDSLKSGQLARQNNIALANSAEGVIQYIAGEKNGPVELVYNTLTNPKGSRVVNAVLNDGTRVWLNAASSITYPVAFEGSARQVDVTGEAYFEVAHDPDRAFVVRTGSLSTRVLGTHFNVNSYPDGDDIKVTLLKGSVKVISANGSSAVIHPGEQAVQGGDAKISIKRAVNMEDVVAWKSERFSFNDDNIKDIMKEVSRWYDVEIEYRGSVDDLNFGGNMSRQKNISELLKRLEATKAVTFKVEGKKVTVISKRI